ncbi:MAG TPA: hypothetical protein VG674_26335 [Amycolatopsis sp.]|nr:hypothetical protein [Amycolatopsis sp.]
MPGVLRLRRFLDLHRPLLVVTGWTHDFGEAKATNAYPIGLHFYRGGYQSAARREVRVAGVTYQATTTMWKTIQPERNNTICLLPRTKLIINVFPA